MEKRVNIMLACHMTVRSQPADCTAVYRE